jgi:hypothetical protein
MHLYVSYISERSRNLILKRNKNNVHAFLFVAK